MRYTATAIALMAAVGATGIARAEQKLAFTPDGRSISVGLYTHVYTWAAGSTTPTRIGFGANNEVQRFAYAPDGGRFAVVTNDGVVLMDIATSKGTVLLKVDPNKLADKQFQDLAWSPDGKSLAVIREGRVIVVDVAAMHGSAWGGPDSTGSLAWSPDGSHLAAASSNDSGSPELHIFNAVSGPTTKVQTHGASSLAWSSAGILLSKSNLIESYDVSGQQQKSQNPYSGAPTDPKNPFGSGVENAWAFPAWFVITANSADPKLDQNFYLNLVSTPDFALRSSLLIPGSIGEVAVSPDGKTLAALVCAVGWTCQHNGDDEHLTVEVFSTTPQLKKLRTLRTKMAGGAPVAAPSGGGGAPAADNAPAGGGGGGGKLTPVPADKQKLASAVAHWLSEGNHVLFEKQIQITGRSGLFKSFMTDCESDVAAAFNAGLPATAQITQDASLSDLVPNTVKVDADNNALALGDVKAVVCSEAHKDYLAALVAEASQDALNYLLQAQKETEISSAFGLYVQRWNDCSKVAADARADGLSADTIIPIDAASAGPLGAPKSVRFGEFDATICQRAKTQGGAIAKKLQAAKDALYAPYLKVLSGDKKKMFHDNDMLDGTNWYGSGGKRLNTPADFKGAGAWYYFVRDHHVWPDKWKVEGHKFAGDKHTGEFSKEGYGDSPPGSAYP